MTGTGSALTRCGVAATVLLGITGCRGGKSCTDTTLAVAAVTASSSAPFVLEANLSAGSRPVADATISFYAKTTAAGSGSSGGSRIGKAATDGGGRARLTFSSLKDLEPLRDERVTAYEAEFRPLNRIGGTLYCASSSPDAEIRRVR